MNTQDCYIPTAEEYQARAAGNGELGRRVAEWARDLRLLWPELKFGEMTETTDGSEHSFEVQVHFGKLNPNAVRMEIYAEPGGPTLCVMSWCSASLRQDLTAGTSIPDEFSAVRPVAHYTARAIPCFSGATVPLEAAQILWRR